MKLPIKDLLKAGLIGVIVMHTQGKELGAKFEYDTKDLEKQFKDAIKEIDQKEIFNVKKN